MKSIDWTAETDDRVENRGVRANQVTYTAARVFIAPCPDCKALLVVFNDHESWPLFACACGWQGSMPEGVLHGDAWS